MRSRLLAVALALLVTLAAGFDYSTVARWGAIFPSCAADVAPQSPISIESFFATKTAAPRSTLAPPTTAAAPTASVGPLPRAWLGDATFTANAPTLLSAANIVTGGLLVAHLTGTTAAYRAPDSGVLQTMRVAEILIHNGVEHALPHDGTAASGSTRNAANAAAFEVQVVLRHPTTDEVYSVVSQRLAVSSDSSDSSAATSNDQGSNLVGVVVRAVTTAATAATLATQVDVHNVEVLQRGQQPLPLLAGGDVEAGFTYTPATLSIPPCAPARRVVVSNRTLLVTALQAQRLRSVNMQTATVRPAQPPLDRAVAVINIVRADATDAPVPTTLPQVRPNSINDDLRVAIIALIAACALLLLYLGALLSARYGYVELPMWLGGVFKAAPLWRNPPSAHVAVIDSSDEGSDDGSDANDGGGDDAEYDDDGYPLGARAMPPAADDGGEGEIETTSGQERTLSTSNTNSES